MTDYTDSHNAWTEKWGTGQITRNHRCTDIEELLDLVFDWLFVGSRFEIETTIYTTRLAA